MFLFLFISLFLFSFFNEFGPSECVIAYFGIIFVVLRQYQRTFPLAEGISKELWYVDSLSLNIKIFLLFLIGLVVIFWYLLDNKNSEIPLTIENLLLILLCTMGILILMTSNHLFVLYLGFELQSLSLYILCSLKRYSNKSLEAGFKYYLYGSFSSALLLLGISFIYLVMGTLNFNDIFLTVSIIEFTGSTKVLLHMGLTFIFVSFLFKLAVFPFHWWLADIYEGSADIITFFLALVTKLPYFYIFYRLYFNIFSQFAIYSYILTFCGVASILVGSLLALYEIKLKKLIAYSSIVHMGYMVLGLALGSKMGTVVAFYYFFIYIIVTIYIFSIFLLVRLSNDSTLRNVTDFVYLKNNRWLAIFSIVALLSLAGIPPLIGFYGKLFIFYTLIASGNYYLCMFLVLLSILSCIYYIRLIRFIFFNDKTYEPRIFIKKQSIYLSMWIALCFLVNSSFLFFQEPFLIHLLTLFL